MVRTKLDELKSEIAKYIGIPYFINIPPVKLDKPENSLVGKGSAKEIALKTVELANKQDIKLLDMSAQDIYNFQKKNKIGIDCSGLVSNLVNFILKKDALPVTQTSANALTSEPLATQIKIESIKTGDLIRQNNGHHVIFIIERNGNDVLYVHSSQSQKGVHYGQLDISKPNLKFDGVFRLKILS